MEYPLTSKEFTFCRVSKIGNVICWDMLGYVVICWDMLGYVGICWDMLGYAGICWDMLGYVGICWDTVGIWTPTPICLSKPPLCGTAPPSNTTPVPFKECLKISLTMFYGVESNAPSSQGLWAHCRKPSVGVGQRRYGDPFG